MPSYTPQVWTVVAEVSGDKREAKGVGTVLLNQRKSEQEKTDDAAHGVFGEFNELPTSGTLALNRLTPATNLFRLNVLKKDGRINIPIDFPVASRFTVESRKVESKSKSTRHFK